VRGLRSTTVTVLLAIVATTAATRVDAARRARIRWESYRTVAEYVDPRDAPAPVNQMTIVRLDAVARLIVRDPELARDAVQDTLIRAWRDLPGLRDPDRFDAWLHRLIVHACLDLVRRRRRRVIEVELTPIDMPAETDMAGDFADRDMLADALARLDPGHRAVVVLHYFLGMPLPEVAAAIGIPLGTAKSRLHYALAAMKVAVLRDAIPSNAQFREGHPA